MRSHAGNTDSYSMNFYICLSLLVLTVVGAAESRKVSSVEVNALADEYFDFRLRENPNVASDHGIPKYQDKVEEWNYAAFNRRKDAAEEYLTRVNSLLVDGQFEDRADQVSLKILNFTIGKFIEGSAYLNYTATVNGDLTGIANDLKLRPIESLEELEYWYEKVVRYQSVFEDQIALLDIGIESGMVITRIAVDAYINRYRKALEGDVFFAFKPWKDLDVMNSNRTFYDEAERQCELLNEKMTEFTNKLENDYLPVSRDMNHTGVSSLQGGDKFYEATLRYYTSDDVTPASVHLLGLDEVERITTDMNKIVADEGFDGTIREFIETLYNDSNEFFPTQAALKQGYEDMLNDKVRPKLGKEFNPEPDIELILVDEPEGSLGRYFSPKWSNNQWSPGIFSYDGSKPHELLKISMLPILVHEALPGHHYQLASVLLTSLPDFRKYATYGHHDQGAYNFPYHTVYIEGWGLYSEYMAEVLGIISTNREMLGRLSLESLRAARLVVDTGIHYFNWTNQRAVDYLIENTILSPATCEQQIKRYIRWPGQACSYKIGELKIKEIRSNAMNKLGDDFDPKSFHQAIIDLGAVPLVILEEEMNYWIDQQPITSSAANLKLETIIVMITSLSIMLINI